MSLTGSRAAGRGAASILRATALLSAFVMFGQQSQLTGIVRDPSGAAVPQAAVTLRNSATNVKVSTEANGSGLYAFPALTAGTYELSVQAAGFDGTIVGGLKVDVAAKVTQDVELRVGRAAEAVTVNARGISINTVDAAVGTVVDRQFVENMPLNGRSFQSLLTLIPGVTAVVSSRGQGQSGSMSVNGQRTEANYFMVDGVSANTGAYPSTPGWGAGYGGSTPGETALGTTQSLVSVDALEEFKATTSTYSAEYGRSPGGQFSFTTRSGNNALHGSLFHFFRNDALDANNFFSNATATAKPKQRQNNFGGTFGGPVVIPNVYNGKDRTFFFASYEGLRLRTPQPAILTDVPSVALRNSAPQSLRMFLNAFPMPNGPATIDGLASFTGVWSNPGTLDSTSVRIDHNITDTFKLFGRFSNSPSNNQTRRTSNMAQLTDQEGSNRAITIGATNVFSARVSNDARFNLTRNAQGQVHSLDNFGGAVPFAVGQIPGYSSADNHWIDFYMQWGLRPTFVLNSKRNAQQQFNFTDSLSVVAGSHRLKFGVDYRRLATSQPSAEIYQFAIFNTLGELNANRAANVTLERFSGGINPIYTNFSAYVQDEWRVKPRLSLSLGLRWDVNPAPTDADGNKPYNADQLTNLDKTALAPHDAPLFATRWANLAPRLGIAYNLRTASGSETVLRFGGGLFYDTANSTASMGYFGVGRATALRYLNGTSAFPATEAQFTQLPPNDIRAPYNFTLYAIDRNLKSPYTFQWSAAIEQALGQNQTLTVSYIGSGARQLPVVWSTNAAALQARNPNFINWGLGYTVNGANSSYNALQMQFQRRLSRGLQASLAHTWSHTIDDATNNFTTGKLLRGNSDYDIRHNFQGAVTYSVPGNYNNGFAAALLENWAADSRIIVRSALPVDVAGLATIDPVTGASFTYQPNLIAGQPLYRYDANIPGGRAINFAAFANAPAGIQGSAGRNIARGFGATQVDFALRRDFPVTERFNLQFRAEAFNIFNHPIFGAVANQLSVGAARFGIATNTQNTQLGGLNSLYQTGGPRSVQLALKLRF